jgi:hypothetical protein
VRSHRISAGRVATTFGVLTVALACCGGSLVIAVVRVAVRDLLGRALGPAGNVLLLIAVVTVIGAGVPAWRKYARDMTGRWAARKGFLPVATQRRWPWTPLVRTPDLVTVKTAFSGSAGGHAVTAGELSWNGNGLGDAVDRWSGHGVFVVARLGGETPSGAVRLRRAPRPRRHGEDEFRRRFTLIADDAAMASRLGDPELQQAHVRGDIPPWTVIGGELFTVTPSRGVVTPGGLERAIAGTLRIAEALT